MKAAILTRNTGTHKPLVGGSNPSAATSIDKKLEFYS